ncbi:MAG: SPASM domain-containing protein [Candidatus Aenigmarchaeota archaeon]|nr:SPASM domain-containing protein [Candidatus Aenigmarchaeota archaeon]
MATSHRIMGSFFEKLLKEIKKGPDIRYRLYRLKWNLAGKYHIKFGFPIHIDIESSSYCNLRCRMCPQSFAPKSIDKGYAEWNMFKKIIDESAKHGLCSIKLNWRGEPLLHKQLPEMVAYAKKHGIIEVMINTNGQLMTKDMSRKLIKAGIDKIIISLDGMNRTTYEHLRQGANYDKLIKNMDDLLVLKKELGAKKPFVRVQTLRMKETNKEVNDYVRFWKQRVDDVAVNEYSNRGEAEKRDVGDYTVVGRCPCPQIWQRMMIAWNGDVMVCCGDWYKKTLIGNVNKSSVKELWDSKKWEHIREMHKQRRLAEVPGCDKCQLQESYDLKKVK